MYSDFLDQTDGTPREKVIRSTAKLQANVYMDPKQAGISSLTQGSLVQVKFVIPSNQ